MDYVEIFTWNIGIIQLLRAPTDTCIRRVKNISFRSLIGGRAMSTLVAMAARRIRFEWRLHQHRVGGLVSLEFRVGHG